MKYRFALLAALCAAPAAAQEFSTSSMRVIAVSDAYALTLARSEALARQAEGAAQLEAAERQFASAFRPSLDFNAALAREQERDASSRGYLSAGYRLFSGMRDYIALKAASSKTGAARLDLERARQRLYLSAAQAFITLQTAQREIFIRAEQLAVTGKRIAELETRASIGRSRRGEVISARSQLAQDKAAYLGALAGERSAQQALKFLTGLSEDLCPAETDLKLRAGLPAYQKLALSRPDVQARRLEAESYGYLSEVQDRGAWPSLDLAANYYVLRDPMPEPENRWDAGIFLKLPLYTGGDLKARKESAASAAAGARLALDQARREALSEVAAAYDEYTYAERQALTLAEALILAEENARYQQEDYKLGLVTNLDVLSALNTARQTALALAQAQARSGLALIKLETAAGAELK
jgi:outer membrane protein TolC